MMKVLERQIPHEGNDSTIQPDGVHPSNSRNTCIEACRWRRHANQFPWKLHLMLEDAETQGFTNIVAWLPDQRTFRVNNKESFVEQVLPQYFRQTQFKSFQRQLNLWGFEHVNQHYGTKHVGGYTHKHFVRGQVSLCLEMKRLKIKGNRPNKRTILLDRNNEKEKQGTSGGGGVLPPRLVSPTCPLSALAVTPAPRGGTDKMLAWEGSDPKNHFWTPHRLSSSRSSDGGGGGSSFRKPEPSSNKYFDLFDDMTLASVLIPPEEEPYAAGKVNNLLHHANNGKTITSIGDYYHHPDNMKMPSVQQQQHTTSITARTLSRTQSGDCWLPSESSIMGGRTSSTKQFPSPVVLVAQPAVGVWSSPPPQLTQPWYDQPRRRTVKQEGELLQALPPTMEACTLS